MKYLLNHWGKYREILQKSHVLLCLDYDGTLTPIVKTPQKAILAKATKKLLHSLSIKNRLRVAVISGRSLKNVKKKIGIKKVIYAGNHGLEIDFPGVSFSDPTNKLHILAIKRVYTALKNSLATHKGLIIENKKASLSVHFRLADNKGCMAVKKEVKKITSPFILRKILKVNSGKKVFEIKPDISWDKGHTVLWLLKKYKAMLKIKNLFPIYIGDDVTDEDAFKAIGKKGLTVYVGGNSKKFSASYYLKNVREVILILKEIEAISR